MSAFLRCYQFAQTGSTSVPCFVKYWLCDSTIKRLYIDHITYQKLQNNGDQEAK